MDIGRDANRAALADACRLLSTCMRLPTSDLFKSMTDGSFATSIRALLPELDCDDNARSQVEIRLSHCDVAAHASTLSELRHDFTRLFTHPQTPLVPSSESLFKSWERNDPEKPLAVVNRLAMRLDEDYQAAGYHRSNGGVIPPDHMSTELEFLTHLLDDRPENSGDAAAFIECHLGTWAPRFFALVEEQAITPEYALIGSLGVACFA